MDRDSSESGILIITKRYRLKLFWRLYWRNLILVITPILLLPIIQKSNASRSFYVFLITSTYWVADVLHPIILSLVSIILWTIIGSDKGITFYQIPIRNELLDSISVMIITFAIEKSGIARRVVIKLLLQLGCSHYRLSFVLFFTSMFLSMLLTDIIACGLMIPFVQAVLVELETMGLLELYQTVGKIKLRSERHEQRNLRPTEFTVFYFLGIAYSSSIGSLATLIGSRSNQIFKMYCESLFPSGPPIEFPHIILLNLPGVLLMETLLYMWMNAYFLGMFRTRSDIAIEISLTEEEARYINTLLETQYQQMGKRKFQEMIVAVIVVLAATLQIVMRSITDKYLQSNSYLTLSSPCLITAVLLFITPTNLEFIRFFKKQGINNRLPNAPSKSCLNWILFRDKMYWSVLFVTVSTTATMEALKTSGLMQRTGFLLEALSGWPPPALALVLIVLCKALTEFANNPCVVYCVLPTVASLSVASSMNPHYLMMAATISCSLPFHLTTGSPVNAMVAAYVHIPPWKVMSAGVGPSAIAIVVSWLTVAVWSRAIWPDIQSLPKWPTVQSVLDV